MKSQVGLEICLCQAQKQIPHVLIHVEANSIPLKEQSRTVVTRGQEGWSVGRIQVLMFDSMGVNDYGLQQFIKYFVKN
jgi:hypothetical protein